MTRVFLATIAGAIISVIWGGVSWMALDWHSSSMQHFVNEEAVAKALVENAPMHGLYVLPDPTSGARHVPTAESQAAAQKVAAKFQAGPFVYAVVRPGARASAMGLSIALAFARSLVACFIIALLMRQTTRLDYIQKVGFSVLFGLFAGLTTDLPMLIWFEFPLRATLINVADHLCEWFLAGLVMGGIVEGKEGY